MPQSEININSQNNGLITQFRAWFTNLFARSRNYFVNIGTREVLPDVDAETAICEGFNASAAVYAIVEKDANKFASIPRLLVDAKLEKLRKKLPIKYKALAQTTPVSNKLADLLKRPNPYQGQAAFFKITRAFYNITGESFIWLNRGDLPDNTELDDTAAMLYPILEMYILPSNMMRIVPDPENYYGVIGYIFVYAGVEIPIRKADIIHWKKTNLTFDPINKTHLRGMSPLKPGAATLQQNKDSTLSSVRMYQNDGAKGFIFGKNNPKMTPQQESDIRAVINRKINNNDIKGAVAVINGDWGYTDLGNNSVDMELIEGNQWTWKTLCALWGVPYQMFDPSVTYANLEFAQKNWITNDIIPATQELDDELNRILLRAFAMEGRFVIQCDYSKLAELQEDLAQMNAWLLTAWWFTPNEKREMQGAEPLGKEFDEPWLPQGLTPLSVLQQQQENSMSGVDELMNQVAEMQYGKNGKNGNGAQKNGSEAKKQPVI